MHYKSLFLTQDYQ